MKRLMVLLTLIVAIATLALMKSDSDYMRNVYERILVFINQQRTQVVLEKAQQDNPKLIVAPQETKTEIKQRFSTRSSEISPSKAIIALNQISFSGDKVDYIRKNLHSMPNDLRLPEVTNMLKSISFSSDKVKAVELLGNKISKYYSDKEYSDFMRTIPFSSDKVKVAKCTAIGNLDHSLRQDYGIITICLKGASDPSALGVTVFDTSRISTKNLLLTLLNFGLNKGWHFN